MEIRLFADDAHLKSCPNAGLIYQVIKEFLVEGRGAGCQLGAQFNSGCR